MGARRSLKSAHRDTDCALARLSHGRTPHTTTRSRVPERATRNTLVEEHEALDGCIQARYAASRRGRGGINGSHVRAERVVDREDPIDRTHHRCPRHNGLGTKPHLRTAAGLQLKIPHRLPGRSVFATSRSRTGRRPVPQNVSPNRAAPPIPERRARGACGHGGTACGVAWSSLSLVLISALPRSG